MVFNPRSRQVRDDLAKAYVKSIKGTRLTPSSLLALKKGINGSCLSVLEAIHIAFPRERAAISRFIEEQPKLLTASWKRTLVDLIVSGKPSRCLDCRRIVHTHTIRCVSCMVKTPEHIQAIKKSILASGGHHMQTAAGKERFKESMLRSHGVPWAGESKALQEKGRETHKRKTGYGRWAETPEGRSRLYQSNHDPETIKQRVNSWKTTMQKTYGDAWRLINHQRLSASRYRYTDITINGRVYTCQGYEPAALVWLHRKGFDLKSVELSKNGFSYTKLNGEKALYIPDIVFTKDPGFVIEVKSSYTAGLTKSRNSKRLWLALQRKAKGVEAAGKPLDLLVCSGKKVLLHIRNPQNTSQNAAMKLLRFALQA